jgi:hypothetical protein
VLAKGTLLRDRFGPGVDLVSDVAGPPPALPEEPRVAAVFRALDLDRDGYLVHSQMRVLMERLGEPMSDEAARVFLALADGDRDGRISLPELLHQLAPGDRPPAGGDDHPSPGTTSPVS